MTPRLRPTAGLTIGERRVFWRLYGACGDVNSRDIDIEDYLRNVARTVVARQKIAKVA